MKAVIIGFYYKEGQSIPGISIDLYKAYMLFSSMCDRVIVITDMVKPVLPYNIADQIIQGRVDGDIFAFPSKQVEYVVVGDYLELKNALIRLLKDDKVILYYSGHGESNGVLMPNGECIDLTVFKSLLLDNISSQTQLFIMMDCCHTNGLGLAFRLSNGYMRLNPNNKVLNLINKDVVLITSNDLDQKAVSTQNGSLFSEVLFDELRLIRAGKAKALLTPLTIRINQRMKDAKTGHNQTCNVYASLPALPILWGWLANQLHPKVISGDAISLG